MGADPVATSSGDTRDLQGWKEIASYLGRSVRAVQRWEGELGLPVHRLKTAAGQSIYARRAEIDEWRRRQSIPPAEAPDLFRDADSIRPDRAPDGNDSHQPPPLAQSAEAARPWHLAKWRWIAAGLGTLALVIALVSAFTRLGTGAQLAPVAFSFSDDALVARDETGVIRWRHVFPAPIVAEREAGLSRTPVPARRVVITDLDGDGGMEVLAVVSYVDLPNHGDELYCFSLDGRLRWRYRLEMDLKFGGGSYGPPWSITAMMLAGSSQPGAQDVYIAVIHHLWWPSVVIRVAPDGTAERVLVQSGHIYNLLRYDHEGVDYIAAGGVNNEYAAASLAIVAARGDPVQSPQSPGGPFACRDCPDALPLRYVLFEQAEVGRVSDSAYNRVAGILPHQRQLQVFTREDLFTNFADTIFHITPQGNVSSVQPTDGYWKAHRRLHAAGHLDHDSGACRERERHVRIFERGSGWRTVTVPLEGPVPGGVKP